MPSDSKSKSINIHGKFSAVARANTAVKETMLLAFILIAYQMLENGLKE